MVAKIRSEGLGLKQGETRYDYCVRLAEYMNRRFEYGECDISKEQQKSPAIFNAKFMQCQEAAVFAATCIRSSGIPAKLNSGLIFSDTGLLSGYHTDLEVFSPEKGWFPFNGARVLSHRGPLSDIVGKDYSSIMGVGIGGYLITDRGTKTLSVPLIKPMIRGYFYDFWVADNNRTVIKDTGTVILTTSNISFDEGVNGAYTPELVKSSANILAESSWNAFSMEGSQGKFTEGLDGTVRFDTYKVGANPWSSQFSLLVDKAQLKPNQCYELSFLVKSDRNKTFGIHSVRLEPPFDKIAMEYHTMDSKPSWTRKTLRFTTKSSGTPGTYRLPCFYVGKALGFLEVKDLSLNELNRSSE